MHRSEPATAVTADLTAGQETGRSAAAAAVILAILASSCCILPFALVLLGVSGAWMTTLTALEPYRIPLAGAAIVCIGVGIWHVYFRPRRQCADGSYCARPGASRSVRLALWSAAALVALTLTVEQWAPLLV